MGGRGPSPAPPPRDRQGPAGSLDTTLAGVTCFGVVLIPLCSVAGNWARPLLRAEEGLQRPGGSVHHRTMRPERVARSWRGA